MVPLSLVLEDPKSKELKIIADKAIQYNYTRVETQSTRTLKLLVSMPYILFNSLDRDQNKISSEKKLAS